MLTLQFSLIATAQTNQCNDAKIKVQVLGSGGPELVTNRASASNLVWYNGKAILLIDTGGGSSLRYSQARARWSDLKAVLFTHFHADHSSEFPTFIKASWFGNRSKDLPVFGPYSNSFMPSAEQFLDRLFSDNKGAYQYLSDMYDAKEGGSYRLIAHTITDKTETQVIFTDELIEISAQKVKHGPIPAFAYIIKLCDKTIVFSGDTNGKGFENLKLKKTDIFIAHNAISEQAGDVAKSLHMTPTQIGEIAKHINTNNLILTHRMNRALGKEPSTAQAIQKNYKHKVIFANDLNTFEVK